MWFVCEEVGEAWLVGQVGGCSAATLSLGTSILPCVIRYSILLELDTLSGKS